MDNEELEVVKRPVAGEKLPKATHSGDLKIGNAVIKCFVLEAENGEDPKRLLSGRAVTKAVGLSGRGRGMNRFLDAARIRNKMSEELVQALVEPIEFSTSGSGLVPALGYEAWVLPQLCFAILDANEESPLPKNQQSLVIQAKILQRGFAIVGINALVDEATGYQNERAKNALEEILRKFISKELAKWAKTFPDEYYEELFRLRNLRYSEFNTKRPQYIGKITNDIIYERLAPGVLEELQKITPKDERGRRRHKYFQRLTLDLGHPKLREHLSNVITLMRASPNWATFYRLLQRALPRFGDQLSMAFDFDDEENG